EVRGRHGGEGGAVNPIVRRELIDALRSRQAVALQAALALSCALLVLVRWPTEETADLTGGRAAQGLRVFSYGLLARGLLVGPASAGRWVVRERVSGPRALLLNTPMSSWSFSRGNLLGVLGFAAVLLIMTLPAAAACHALGGSANRGGILAAYGLLMLAALQL